MPVLTAPAHCDTIGITCAGVAIGDDRSGGSETLKSVELGKSGQTRTFMNLHYIMASMAEPETLRLLLKSTLDRNEGLIKINHEATLAIPTILGIAWGILINFKGGSVILTMTIVSIAILLIWRFLAHYIDNDIASNYSRIMQLEKKLEIPKESSIFCGLIKIITSPIKKQLEKEKIVKKAMDLSENERIKLIETLYENKKMGY